MLLRLRKRSDFDLRDYCGPKTVRHAEPGDAKKRIGTAEEGKVTAIDANTGAHVFTFLRPAVYFRVLSAPLIEALDNFPFQENYRTSGLKSRSCTFGFQPRIPLRRDFCSMAGSATTHPKEHAVLMRYGEVAGDIFSSERPDLYNSQIALVAGAVGEDWRPKRAPFFTSGIANDRNVLHYHRDSGNFKDALSAMYSITSGMRRDSGMLVLPEYDVALEFSGFELLFFNGAKIVHGVTPIVGQTKSTVRYTVVYYALAGMAKCGTPTEELERIKRVKTHRAEQRTTANQAALAEKIAKTTGVAVEDLEKLGERKRQHFETRKIKKVK